MQLSEKLLKNSKILIYVEEKKSNMIWGGWGSEKKPA